MGGRGQMEEGGVKRELKEGEVKWRREGLKGS